MNGAQFLIHVAMSNAKEEFISVIQIHMIIPQFFDNQDQMLKDDSVQVKF